MAKNEKVETAETIRALYYEAYKNEFIGLIINALNIKGLPVGVPKSYIIEKMLYNGKIGVYKDIWLPISESGQKTIYGKPTAWTMTGENGYNFTASSDTIKCIRLTPTGAGVMDWLNLKINRLIDCEIAIKCNIEATKDTTIVLVDNNANKQSLKEALKERALGVPAIVADTAFTNAFKNIQTNTQFLADKYEELKKQTRVEILTRLGIVAGNNDKKERVTSFEIPVNEAIDSIYTFIDTFNSDAEAAGISQRMELNGVIETLYNNESEGVENE